MVIAFAFAIAIDPVVVDRIAGAEKGAWRRSAVRFVLLFEVYY